MSSPMPRSGGGAFRPGAKISTGGGEYASQGMIAPLNNFTDANGTLTPVSFRFLHSLFTCIHELEEEVETIKARLTAAGIP